MGNIFSYYFKSNNIKYNDSLLDPLTKDMDEDIQYASLLDIQSINGQVGILEETTQSSLKNISTDVNYLFEEVNILKKQIDYICKQLEICEEENNQEYHVNHEVQEVQGDHVNHEVQEQEDHIDNQAQPNNNLINLNNEEMSVYLDANSNNSNNINEDGSSSVDETY